MPVPEVDPLGGPLQDEPDVGVEGTGDAGEAPVDLPHLVNRQPRLLESKEGKWLEPKLRVTVDSPYHHATYGPLFSINTLSLCIQWC